MLMKGGYVYYDTPVGVLCLESYFPKPRGHLRNPTTFDFPVVYSIIKGVDIKKLLFAPDQEIASLMVEAAVTLEREGVQTITGSCGFMALFQQEIANAVDIPVLLSSLIQIPMLKTLYGQEAKIGVLTASKAALTDQHFQQVGVDRDSVFIQGMEGYVEFWETIVEAKRQDFDIDQLEKEIRQAARHLMDQYEIDAIVLECTDLSAFSYAIQQETQRPVFDINTLVEFTARGVQPRLYRQS